MSDESRLSPYELQARNARRAVAVAIRQGELERRPCEECEQPAEAHHANGYAPEQWLDVVWLCRRHHAARHFLMHRQWSAVLAEKGQPLTLGQLRLTRGLTQVELARELGVGQANISALEGRTDVAISTLRSYVEALGGRLVLEVRFPEDVGARPITLGKS